MPGVDLVADPDDHPFQGALFQLVDEGVESLDQLETGGKQGRRLAGEDGDVPGLDPVEDPGEGLVAPQVDSFFRLRHLGRKEPLAAELGAGGGGAVRVDDPRRRLPASVKRPVIKYRHNQSRDFDRL